MIKYYISEVDVIRVDKTESFENQVLNRYFLIVFFDTYFLLEVVGFIQSNVYIISIWQSNLILMQSYNLKNYTIVI